VKPIPESTREIPYFDCLPSVIANDVDEIEESTSEITCYDCLPSVIANDADEIEEGTIENSCFDGMAYEYLMQLSKNDGFRCKLTKICTSIEPKRSIE
jgi:hypothetical protein